MAAIINIDCILAQAKKLGCQDAPRYPHTGFLGLGGMKEMMKADKEQLFPDLLVRRQNVVSGMTGRVCTTQRSDLFGQNIYFTTDRRLRELTQVERPCTDVNP